MFEAFFYNVKNILTTDLFGQPKMSAPKNDMDLSDFIRNQISNVRLDADRAMRCATVYACVSLIGNAISQLPLVLYRKTPEGREPATDHRLYNVLKTRPNDYQTPIEFIQFMMTSILLTGKGCAYVSRIGNKVVSLTPISPNSINEVWSDNGDHYFEANVNSRLLRLEPQDVLCIKGLSLDGKRALNPIEYAGTIIGVNIDAINHSKSFLDNGGRPSGVLSTPSVLKKETAELIREEWKKNFSGANAGNVAVLHGGFSYSPVSMSNSDLQLLEMMNYNRNDICAIFCVPPYLVGGAETSSTWGTGIAEQRENFVTFTLGPWMTKICQAITRDLIPESEKDQYYAEFKTDAFLRVNTLSRYQAYQIALGGNNNPAILTQNEVRQFENLPLSNDPNADRLFVPNYNTVNTEEVAKEKE